MTGLACPVLFNSSVGIRKISCVISCKGKIENIQQIFNKLMHAKYSSGEGWTASARPRVYFVISYVICFLVSLLIEWIKVKMKKER